MTNNTNKIILVVIFLCFSFSSNLLAQKDKKKKKGKTTTVTPTPKKDKKPTIASKTKSSKAFDGLFTIYQDTVTGKLQMLIKEEQLNQEYIYFSQIRDGVVEAFKFRGAYDGAKVFKITKYFNRVEFTVQNTSSYFDPENPLSRAADANISHSILTSEKIIAEDKKEKSYLISAESLFLKETFTMIGLPPFPGLPRNRFKLGRLSKDKTKVLGIRNYPENTDLAIEYVFSNPKPTNGGGRAVTDARNVSVKVHYSLIKMPENDYEPRYDDPRVGYFTTQVTDMTSTGPTPYRDLVHRWHLKKKDPNAELSEPVEPIVWWIENTTPLEFRETIKEGVLQWNKAFEKAGFKNAVVVKVQPDDAEWDAGDIRYNVLRWTSSPNPPFGGYGPSFVNPRTGQILGADVMLEFVYHTNRVKYDRIYSFEAHSSNELSLADKIRQNHQKYCTYCSFGEMQQQNTIFGQAAINVLGGDDLEMEGMKKQAMLELVMHEVGHTLGLNHNMKASQLWTPTQLKDKNLIKGKALVGSVMDYAAIHVTRDRSLQGQYFSETVGPYDEWAIEFAYTPVKSEGELEKILARSTEAQLIFGNDADDMRSPGKAIDPRVNTGDMSSDQIAYSEERFLLVNDLMKNLKTKMTKKGESYQELRQAYLILNGQKSQASSVVSRYIGGVYVDRAMVGQVGGTKPYTPVAYKDQKRAMKLLTDYTFAPNAFTVQNDLYNYLAMQRRGYNFFGGPEDPKVHGMVLGMQRNVLRHILHPNTLQRIVDSELYGNKYALSEMMSDLNDAIFKADLNRNVNTFRQNLQIEYTKMLISAIQSKGTRFQHAVKSMALYNLQKIRRIASVNTGNASTLAHKSHLKLLISKALDN